MNDVRLIAAQTLASVLRQQGSLASLLPGAAVKVASRDQPLLQELCYGVCRWQPRLDCYIEQLVEKPLRAKDSDIQALLLLGIYQLAYLRIPDHAALNATVEVAQKLKKPWAKKLINGVLRRFIREREQLDQQLQNIPCFQTAHPQWLIDTIRAAWPKQSDDIFAQNNAAPPFTVRVNQQQFSRDEYWQILKQNDIVAKATPFSKVGLTLDKAIPVDLLPNFDTGAVSVQDEAPQLAAELLVCESNHRVLDACSAPGGKTAHLLETYPDLIVIALDIAEQRLQRTRENLLRLKQQAELVVGDACDPSSWWDGQLFDRILVDAPCSATGIIRRQPDIKILRNPDSVAKLVNTQITMLNALWPLLKKGGELLYATCSILPAENSTLIADFVSQQSDVKHLPIDADWGIEQAFGKQCLPQAQGHDGFYFARLGKI